MSRKEKDSVQRMIEKQKEEELRLALFMLVMLVIMPAAFIVGITLRAMA